MRRAKRSPFSRSNDWGSGIGDGLALAAVAQDRADAAGPQVHETRACDRTLADRQRLESPHVHYSPARPGHRRRRSRRPDGRRNRARRRSCRRPVRSQGLGRAQVPDRRQGRTQPHPQRSARAVRQPLRRTPGPHRELAARLRCRRAARMGRRAGRRNLRRQFGTRVSHRPEGGAAAARLGPAAARAGCAFPRAAPLDRLRSRRCIAFRHTRWPGRAGK